MKKIALFIGLLASLVSGFAFANAEVTSLQGTAQVATGTAVARVLRVGDVVRQGDTVSTGAGSSLVLRFEDGQVAALAANARMAVTTYTYNAQAQTGNVLLSLIDGGMRAVTGLIGRRNPQQVAYRAATATIGIRGTDVSLHTTNGNVVVSVTAGAIGFTFGGQTVTVPAGQGVNARRDGTFQQTSAATLAAELAKTPEGQEALRQLNGLDGLKAAIERAANSATSAERRSELRQAIRNRITGATGNQSGGGTTSTK